MTIDARLAYRNKGDPENEWKHYASSVVERNLDCSIEKVSFNILFSYFFLIIIIIFNYLLFSLIVAS